MHHIYHTEGIILGSRNLREADRSYSIFTKDLGMIHASAQSVRKMESKLRYILHDFAYVRVDLVQGRDFWRVTSAEKTNLLEGLVKNRSTFLIFANIARLLKRLLAGVEQNEPLFTSLLDGLFLLEKAQSEEEKKSVEINIVLMILDRLGYIEEGRAKTRREAINIINQALKETHL